MDPKNQPQFNPKIPISEVLKQEQSGFVPSEPKLKDVVSAISNMYSSTKDPGTVNPVPTNPTTPNSTAESTPNPQPSPVKIIKTYRSDAAEAVKVQHASVAKIAIAEDGRRRERGENVGPAPKKKIGLLLTAIMLITLGAVAIPIVQYVLNKKEQGVPIAVEKTIIPFDHEQDLILDNATRNEFLSALDVVNAKPPANSAVEYRKVFEKIQDVDGKTLNQKITPQVFASLIGPNMPSALARSFDSDYMYGTADSKNPKPFILFKTSSYQQTFANMLRWESKMTSDLGLILGLDPGALGHTFTDNVVVNKDVRDITSDDGTVLFLYGFLDDQTLIITTDTETFQEVNSRYITTHFVQ
jgi:hypothetical protein